MFLPRNNDFISLDPRELRLQYPTINMNTLPFCFRSVSSRDQIQTKGYSDGVSGLPSDSFVHRGLSNLLR